MIFYKRDYGDPQTVRLDLEPSSIKKDVEKTRVALETAYSGFNNALDPEVIDSYVYEIDALQKRLQYLTGLLLKESAPKALLPKRSFNLSSLLFRRKGSRH